MKYQRGRNCEIIIRINALESDYWQADLDEVIPLKPDLIMPVKVGCGGDVRRIAEYITQVEEKAGVENGSIGILPLIESALGVENAFEIAGADSRVMGIFLGGEDMTADLHCKRTKEGREIFYSRNRIVCAARACGVEAYDTPFTDVDDIAGLERDTQFAKSLGF